MGGHAAIAFAAAPAPAPARLALRPGPAAPSGHPPFTHAYGTSAVFTVSLILTFRADFRVWYVKRYSYLTCVLDANKYNERIIQNKTKQKLFLFPLYLLKKANESLKTTPMCCRRKSRKPRECLTRCVAETASHREKTEAPSSRGAREPRPALRLPENSRRTASPRAPRLPTSERRRPRASPPPRFALRRFTLLFHPGQDLPHSLPACECAGVSFSPRKPLRAPRPALASGRTKARVSEISLPGPRAQPVAGPPHRRSVTTAVEPSASCLVCDLLQ